MDHRGKKLLDVAKDELGYAERNSGYTKFGDWYGKKIEKDGYFKKAPWCDMFLAWAADKAGVKATAGQFAYTVSHAKWFKRKDAWGNKPMPGAIVFFDWSGSNSVGAIDHVGIVERVKGHKVYTIEGNVGNKLTRKVRTDDVIVGYGYPGRVKIPRQPTPAQKAAAAKAAANLAAARKAAAKKAVAAQQAAAAKKAATAHASGQATVSLAGYGTGQNVPAPSVADIMAGDAGIAAQMNAGTAARTGEPHPAALPGQEAVLTGMLGVILVGTMALSAGRAGKPLPRFALPSLPSLPSWSAMRSVQGLAASLRMRTQGRHHRGAHATATAVAAAASVSDADADADADDLDLDLDIDLDLDAELELELDIDTDIDPVH